MRRHHAITARLQRTRARQSFAKLACSRPWQKAPLSPAKSESGKEKIFYWPLQASVYSSKHARFFETESKENVSCSIFGLLLKWSMQSNQ